MKGRSSFRGLQLERQRNPYRTHRKKSASVCARADARHAVCKCSSAVAVLTTPAQVGLVQVFHSHSLRAQNLNQSPQFWCHKTYEKTCRCKRDLLGTALLFAFSLESVVWPKWQSLILAQS